MKPILGFLLIICLVGCGKDSPTGPQGQTLEVWTEKYDNGNIKIEFQYYRDGGAVVKHGYYKAYGEDGQIEIESTYKEGERWSGEFEYVVEWGYDEDKWVETEKEVDDGNRIFRGRFTYSDGKWNGKAVLYYQNGQIEWERNYKDGEKDGKWVIYDREGNITDADIYEDGKCVEMCEGDE